MKQFILLIGILFLCIRLSATAQIPDILIYKGKEYSMFTNPLEIYLDSIGNRQFPEFVGGGSTACWRGYQAIWTIKEDTMYLTKIQACHKDEGDVDANLSIMFGDKCKNGKVPADWYSGLVILPRGRLKRYIHMGYGSVYSKYTLIEICKGEMTQELNLNSKEYEEFKTRQFAAFKKTSTYTEMVENLKKNGYEDEAFIDSFLRNYVINYTTKILTE